MVCKTALIVLIPIALSAFTHLWNPAGFPDIFYDEGVYMRRVMNVLAGLGPQESATYYDHPYFGQLFIAGILKIIDYPQSLHITISLHSIEMLYFVPKILMGLLAVTDTYLIYRIGSYRYNRNIGLMASILFAVLPITLFTRRILLEPIQLPFLLSSILFAFYAQSKRDSKLVESEVKSSKVKSKAYLNKNIIMILLSGLSLGLAIFTKIPAITLVPLVAFIILTNNYKIYSSWKMFALWLVPVVLVSAIWPLYSLALGQFDYWWQGISYQTNREHISLVRNVWEIFRIDPIICLLFLPGIVLAAVRRDLFLLLWSVPNMIFLYLVGYVSFRLFIPLIPMLCVTISVMIAYLAGKIKTRNFNKVIPWTIITVIAFFGVMSTSILVTTTVTSKQFQATAYVLSYLDDFKKKFEKTHNLTTAASPTYAWILKYVYGKDFVLYNYRDVLYEKARTDKILLIDDLHFRQDSRSNSKLKFFYNYTSKIAEFNSTGMFTNNLYPDPIAILNREGIKDIEIRVGNYTNFR